MNKRNSGWKRRGESDSGRTVRDRLFEPGEANEHRPPAFEPERASLHGRSGTYTLSEYSE